MSDEARNAVCDGCVFAGTDGLCGNDGCEEYEREPLCDVLCACHTPEPQDGCEYACVKCAFSKDGICQHKRCSLFGKPATATTCRCFTAPDGRGGGGMTDIRVTGYVGECGYRGYIEPQDLGWILYIRDDGTPEFYPRRDPKTGAISTPPATV